jgi:hypothetical protein
MVYLTTLTVAHYAALDDWVIRLIRISADVRKLVLVERKQAPSYSYLP